MKSTDLNNKTDNKQQDPYSLKNYSLVWTSVMIGMIMGFLVMAIMSGIGGFFNGAIIVTGSVLFSYIGGWITLRQFNKPSHKRFSLKRNKQQNDLPPLSPSKRAFYEEQGLDENDIVFFRRQMAKTKEQVIALEKTTRRSTKLKAVMTRYDLFPILKDYFNEITMAPKRLYEVEALLYSYIPSLLEISEKYLDIEKHVSKSKETFQTMTDSIETVEALCASVQRSYREFMSDDIDDITIDLQLAKERLEQDKQLLEMSKEEKRAVPDMALRELEESLKKEKAAVSAQDFDAF